MDNRMPQALRNVDKKQYPYECEICSRPMKHIRKYNNIVVCEKHYRQALKYKRFLDDNPRRITDPNDIYIKDGVAYVELYDRNNNVIAVSKFDIEDIPKISRYKWYYGCGYANVKNRKIKHMAMHRLILNTDQFVDHINHDKLDNRKENLREVTKSQNAMNMNTKGITMQKNGHWTAQIRKNGKTVNLGTYEHKEQALFARWYAEQLAFGEYAYKKEMPVIPDFLKKDIVELVNEKVQRL